MQALAKLRRTYPREDVRWPARWRPSDGPHKTLSGEICDVSPSGIFLRPVDAPQDTLAVGASVEVDFYTPGRVAHIRVRGVLRWAGLSRAHGCVGLGIEFDEEVLPLHEYFNCPELVVYTRRS